MNYDKAISLLTEALQDEDVEAGVHELVQYIVDFMTMKDPYNEGYRKGLIDGDNMASSTWPYEYNWIIDDIIAEVKKHNYKEQDTIIMDLNNLKIKDPDAVSEQSRRTYEEESK